MSADKKDYERICAEFGVTNFRWMLKKLNEIKKEREEEQKLVGVLFVFAHLNSKSFNTSMCVILPCMVIP